MSLPPEIREQRSDEREVFALINALRKSVVGGTAPSDARYWLSEADASLTSAVDMSTVGDGILRQTVLAGVSTPALVTVGTGLSFVAPILRLADTAVTPSSYTYASLTVDQQGRLTAASSGAAPAPVGATFITQTPNATLTNEQALSLLATGLVKNTTGTGVLSIALAGTDYESPLTFSTGLTRAVNTITADLSTGIAGGQSVIGGTGASETLTYSSTTNGTKGTHVWGTTSKMYFNEASPALIIGTASPFSQAIIEAARSVNAAAAFTIVNTSAGASAYAAFFLAQDTTLATGATFGTFLFSPGSGFGLPYGPNIGLFELAGGAGNMHFWIQQNVGDFVWYTKPTFPSTNERMRLTTAGVLSVTDLGAAGTGRLVKAAVTTGILSVATAADVAGAITWPTAAQVLVSSGTSTAPVGDTTFVFDTTANELGLGVTSSLGHYNLGITGAGTYERVRAIWVANEWALISEAAGGTVRNMVITADTATLTLSAGGGATLVGGVVGAAASITAGNLVLQLQAPVSRTSSAGATLNAILVTGSTVSVTSNVNITTALGFNYVSVARPTYNGTGGAKTITNAATVAIVGAPIAGGDVAITTAITLWVQGGRTRLDGDATVAGSGGSLGFFGFNGAAQQVSAANLTNNVTAGGVNDTIANFTDLVTYANDAAAIRNDIYQLARKLKQINDGLRAYNMFT